MDNQDLRISEPTPASSSRSHRKSRKLEDERHNDDIEKEIEEPVGGSIRSASTTSGGVRKGRTKRKRIEQNHRKKVGELFNKLSEVLGNNDQSDTKLTRPLILEMAIERLSAQSASDTGPKTATTSTRRNTGDFPPQVSIPSMSDDREPQRGSLSTSPGQIACPYCGTIFAPSPSLGIPFHPSPASTSQLQPSVSYYSYQHSGVNILPPVSPLHPSSPQYGFSGSSGARGFGQSGLASTTYVQTTSKPSSTQQHSSS